MLTRVLDWIRQSVSFRSAPGPLATGLDVAPVDRDLSYVMPVILPAELMDLTWPGPIVRMDELPFCVAWANCSEINRFFYVTFEEAGFWNEKGIDWRAKAMENLVRISLDLPASGEKRDNDGRPFLKVMLHDDAIGPSRLLIPHLFDDVLGPDYEVALPERTCAIAYRKDLSPTQAADVSEMIDGCYARGTEPMSPERFAAGRFWKSVEASAREL